MAAPTNALAGVPGTWVPSDADIPADLAALEAAVVEPSVVVNVTAKLVHSNVATLFTDADHGLVVGDTATVATVGAVYNGAKVVTGVPSARSFQFAVTSPDVYTVVTAGAVDFIPSGQNTITPTAATGTVTSSGAWPAGSYIDLADDSVASWDGSAWVAHAAIDYASEFYGGEVPQPGGHVQTVESDLFVEASGM